MKIPRLLFLSHCPHECHLEWAKSLKARIKVIPFDKYVLLTKKFRLLKYFYPLVSLIYSLFIKVKEDVLLVEGGSSLYVAVFLKMRCPQLKIIYLDVDTLFYSWHKKIILTRRIHSSLFFRPIDAVISVSNHNKKYASMCLDVPIQVSPPYPKKVKKRKLRRNNYGLYVGRLDPDKNIKRILNFALSCPYIEKFIIIGDGSLRNYVKKLTQKHKKFLYLGKKNKIDRYYSKCKFLIHIPDADPHPCTTMEAALCGCYPIISRGVGTEYLFHQIFIIDDPNNFKEINKRIKYFLGHEKEMKKLLEESVNKIPTKKQSLKRFKNQFKKTMEKIYVPYKK